MSSSWVVEVEEDETTGGCYLTFPIDLLHELGWSIGDVIKWKIDEQGFVTLDKLESNTP